MMKVLAGCIFLVAAVLGVRCDGAVVCQVRQGYTIANLTSASYWTYASGETQCLGIGNGTCVYHFSFCSSLQVPGIPGCNGDAICIVPQDQTIPPKSLGDYNQDINPFLTQSSPDNVIEAQYKTPKPLTPSCDSTTTNVTFSCNHQNPWLFTAPPAESRIPGAVSVRFNIQSCTVDIKFEYAGACYTFTPHDVTEDKLSAGSILLILFFVFVILYLGLGIAFKYSFGARGWEAVPNRDFWVSVPDLMYRGFLYTMGLITCQGNQQRYTEKTPTVGTGQYDAI